LYKTIYNMVACFPYSKIRQRKGGRKHHQDESSFLCNLMLHPALLHNHFIRSESPGPAHTQGEGFRRA
jgi:hypothetical protein